MSENQGVIYILTNPSFPDYVKIGYADDVQKRLKELNRSECIPFAFRLYAYYDVPQRLTDNELHNIIDAINPTLRAVDEFDGKRRVREFYNISKETAYKILEGIAKINGLEKNLHKAPTSEEEIRDEETAEENKYLSQNRHHFKEIEFASSLTGHKYKSGANANGTLFIVDLNTHSEVPNNSHPSKREIVKVALSDLTKKEEDGTLYQLMHRLEKQVLDIEVNPKSWTK